MTSTLVLLVCLLLAVPLIIAIRRSTELFYLKLEDGKLRHVRGRLPPRLLEDIREIVARSSVKQAKLSVITEHGSARLVANGEFSEAQLQQLRNVIGTYRVAQIRAGRRPKSGS